MKVDLASFLDETLNDIPFTETLELESLDIGEKNIVFIEPVKVSGHIYKMEGTNYLTADISFKYVEKCDRCLKEFIQTINTVLSGELREKSEGISDFDEKDEEIVYYEGNELNLRQPIINTIIISLPMKSLCIEGCKGLCPKCGKDLNEGQCDCVIEDIDPRLAKLKDFFE
ncbi:MAG: DUF177 domain-containing protein [Clostridiaceae bacterium]|nr:DUF177 domain-containing protein [Clostridiaceae bacterium]MBW4858702.1 DUF177 domain-containing protein [Clostridiaceae bacterium]MBW4868161.1 DUF177 domain-containing protein [Clostridiaceae bacterium]